MTRLRPRGTHRRVRQGRRGLVAAASAVALIALCLMHGPRTAPQPIGADRPYSATLAGPRPASPSAPVLIPAAPAAAARPVLKPTAATAATTRVTLHPGDTLWALARTHGTTVTALQALNGLGRSTLIYAGHTLLVPATAVPATFSANDNAVPAPVSGASGRAAVAVAFAARQIGVPYLWGGTGAGGYDCSGLVQAAWHAAGVDLPRTTYQRIGAGTRITRDRLQPGDLVFSNNDGHVQLYVGHDTVIQAPHTGAYVEYSPLPPPGQVDAYVRVAPAG
jgi:cell wall-associated NlpC family hydrolase